MKMRSGAVVLNWCDSRWLRVTEPVVELLFRRHLFLGDRLAGRPDEALAEGRDLNMPIGAGTLLA